jgi:energy-coupling factor transporter ATP-binding protein EcfA2
LAREEIEERVDWALALVGMSDLKDRSPFHLSGGQKQRVAIASILAMTPRILVLDEPTASLDPLGKAEVFQVVRELRIQRGMTIIMVSHESEHIAEFSDRVVVLKEGRIELTDTPDRVFSQIERMREIGLAVPQVSELADCLKRNHNMDFAFTRLDEAHRALKSRLDGR